MPTITVVTVTITGNPPNIVGHYSGPNVTPDGNVTVEPGTTDIQFVRGTGQAWAFQSPWITYPEDAPFTLGETVAGEVDLIDNDPGGKDESYEYTLSTSWGKLDPRIINKG